MTSTSVTTLTYHHWGWCHIDVAMTSLGVSLHPSIILNHLAELITSRTLRQRGLESNLIYLNLRKLFNLSVSSSVNWGFLYLPGRVHMYLSCLGDLESPGSHHRVDPIFFHFPFSHSAPPTLTMMFFKQTRHHLNGERSYPRKENG